MESSTVAVATALLLTVVFVSSAVGKLRSRSDFASSLVALGLVRAPNARVLAWLVPTAEAGTAAALLTALVTPAVWLTHGAAAASLVMLGMFTVVATRAVLRGDQARCACFGHRGAVFAPRHIVRNVVLMLAAVALSVVSPADPVILTPGVGMAAGVGVLFAVLVIVLDDLADLFRPTRTGTHNARAAKARRP